MSDIDWDAFRAGLLETLATLPNRGVLIIEERRRSWHSVQFQLLSDHLRGEVASGLDQLGRANATDEELAALEAAGWEPPPDVRDNHGTSLPWPAPTAGYARLVAMSVTALRTVFEVPTPADLCYQAWSNLPGGGKLTMLALGIEPAVDRQT